MITSEGFKREFQKFIDTAVHTDTVMDKKIRALREKVDEILEVNKQKHINSIIEPIVVYGAHGFAKTEMVREAFIKDGDSVLYCDVGTMKKDIVKSLKGSEKAVIVDLRSVSDLDIDSVKEIIKSSGAYVPILIVPTENDKDIAVMKEKLSSMIFGENRVIPIYMEQNNVDIISWLKWAGQRKITTPVMLMGIYMTTTNGSIAHKVFSHREGKYSKSPLTPLNLQILNSAVTINNELVREHYIDSVLQLHDSIVGFPPKGSNHDVITLKHILNFFKQVVVFISRNDDSALKQYVADKIKSGANYKMNGKPFNPYEKAVKIMEDIQKPKEIGIER